MERKKMTITVCIDYIYDPSKSDEETALYSAVDLGINTNYDKIIDGVKVEDVDIWW